jgi:hypothetical protein
VVREAIEGAGKIVRVNSARPLQRENLGQSQVRNQQYILRLDVHVNNPLAMQMIDADELIAAQNTDSQNTVRGRKGEALPCDHKQMQG